MKAEVTPEKLEDIMRQTRIRLLKIPEVLSVKCGKNVDLETEWAFFLAIDLESMERLAACQADPIHVKFVEEVLTPNTVARMALDYETDPGRNIRYS